MNFCSEINNINNETYVNLRDKQNETQLKINI